MRHVRSISDILGSPPPLPNNRRPSLLCTCCNSIHVCQTLPGMSLTPNLSLSRCNSSLAPNSSSSLAPNSSSSPTYHNLGNIKPYHVGYESVEEPTQRTAHHLLSEDSLTDYEDIDQEEEEEDSPSPRRRPRLHSNKDYECVSVDIDEGYDPDHSKSDYEDLDEINCKSGVNRADTVAIELDVDERNIVL